MTPRSSADPEARRLSEELLAELPDNVDERALLRVRTQVSEQLQALSNGHQQGS